MQPRYKRVILKLSGEALAGENAMGFDYDILSDIAEQIRAVAEMKVEIGIVVGGGNFWRGRQGAALQMDASAADHMGMLSTVINALALQDIIERKGLPTRVHTAVEMRAFAETYVRRRAIQQMQKGYCVIFASGTGNPFFSTDSAAALRASEIGAEIVLKATNIDGVYDDDPRKNPAAKRFDSLSFDEAIRRELGVMDNTAFALCKNSGIPIFVFALEPGSILKAVCGEIRGTYVSAGSSAP